MGIDVSCISSESANYLDFSRYIKGSFAIRNSNDVVAFLFKAPAHR